MSSFHPVYQSHLESLASRRDEFRRLLAEIAHYLAAFAVTKQEKSVCWEVQRGKSLSIAGLEILCELAARSDRPFVLENGIQRAVLQRIAAPSALCITDTFIRETRVQGETDAVRTLFHVERTPTRRDQAADWLGRHIAALTTDLKAVLSWPRTSWERAS